MINYKEKYGRTNSAFADPYDRRDWKFRDSVFAVSPRGIPDNYQTKDSPFTYDQGSTMMCAACAYNFIRFLQEREAGQSELTEPLSPAFTYCNRPDEEAMEGMYLKSPLRNGKNGSILFTEFPDYGLLSTLKVKFDANKTNWMKKAKPFAINSYYECNSRKEVQQAIMNTGAVLIGIQVYDCFYTPDKNGHINYDPNKDYRSDGGHALAVYGWKTDKNGKLWWLVKNSWGEGYGIKGSCWLPEEYPWMQNAYVAVDNTMEMKFTQYMEKFYGDHGVDYDVEFDIAETLNKIVNKIKLFFEKMYQLIVAKLIRR